LLRPYRDQLHALAKRLISRKLQPHIDAADLVQELKLIQWLGFSSGAYDVATPSFAVSAIDQCLLLSAYTHICCICAENLAIRR
jgi:hypothetical protein